MAIAIMAIMAIMAIAGVVSRIIAPAVVFVRVVEIWFCVVPSYAWLVLVRKIDFCVPYKGNVEWIEDIQATGLYV